MSENREWLRSTFDVATDRYDRARPDYPDELFEELTRLTGVHPGDRVLGVGCATGKATRPLAARGLHVTCIELGVGLAVAARRNLAAFSRVEVVQTDFARAWYSHVCYIRGQPLLSYGSVSRPR